MELITNVNKIYAGETIYHIPTYKFSKNPKRRDRNQVPWTGLLPPEFRQITPVSKGTTFRDWTDDDEFTPEERAVQDVVRQIHD